MCQKEIFENTIYMRRADIHFLYNEKCCYITFMHFADKADEL